MFRKIALYIKCVALNGVQNPFRFILTVVGIFIGVVVLSYATFFMDAYYNGQMEEVELMPTDTFIACNIDDKYYDQICSVVLNNNPELISCITESKWLLGEWNYSETHVFLYSNIVGTRMQNSESLYINSGNIRLRKLSLLDGRLISNEDIANKNNVVVIDEYTAMLLFPEANPIGQELLIQGEVDACTYEIIGVISANYEWNNQITNLKKNMEQESVCFLETTIYIPSSLFEDDFSSEIVEDVLLWSNLDEQQKSKGIVNIKNILKKEYNENIIDVIVEKEKIYNEISTYKNLFVLFYFVVFIFSGLNSMNVFLFSVKERISEIGIRKAYGASKEDIVIQFMMEAIIISTIASLFAILVALILMIHTLPIASTYLGLKLVIKAKINVVMFPFLVATFQGILVSIIPSIYASSIKVVDALRFD